MTFTRKPRKSVVCHTLAPVSVPESGTQPVGKPASTPSIVLPSSPRCPAGRWAPTSVNSGPPVLTPLTPPPVPDARPSGSRDSRPQTRERGRPHRHRRVNHRRLGSADLALGQVGAPGRPGRGPPRRAGRRRSSATAFGGSPGAPRGTRPEPTTRRSPGESSPTPSEQMPARACTYSQEGIRLRERELICIVSIEEWDYAVWRVRPQRPPA
jgi:hypothetical protein